jgi:hypothetical protein
MGSKRIYTPKEVDSIDISLHDPINPIIKRTSCLFIALEKQKYFFGKRDFASFKYLSLGKCSLSLWVSCLIEESPFKKYKFIF